MTSIPLLDTSLGISAAKKGVEDDGASTIRQPSLYLSDDEPDNEEQDFHYPGDYSTQMEELLGEGDSDALGDDEDDPQQVFVYTGIDVEEPSGGYRDQLRDVLGAEHEDDEADAHEVETSLLHDAESEKVAFRGDDGLQHSDVLSDHSFSISSVAASLSLPMTPPIIASTSGTPSKLSKPFLHPTVSRLRSYTPQQSHSPSNASVGTFRSHIFDGTSPSPSHFSSKSRSSSLSNIHSAPHGDSVNEPSPLPREVFRWTHLRSIGNDIFADKPSKAASVLGSVLGSVSPGSPTVLAANGLICIGTDTGKIFVYDFKQTLKCICGSDSTAKAVGAVTALALSHDHTYVAAGHDSGHIQLFDLSNPQTPARSVVPTTLAAVSSGRQEGHLTGSRIVSIGFVAGRHTAVVTADETGLAFYHSLGKVLFVDASDVLRILGKYPDQEIVLPPPRTSSRNDSPRPPQNGSGTTQNAPHTPQNGHLPGRPPVRRRRARYTILGMAPLPLGTSPHPTDVYNIVALLTPAKLVIIGLKPTPRTWFKCPREVDEESKSNSKSRWKGTLAWFPSVLPAGGAVGELDKKRMLNGKDRPVGTIPILVYSWGNKLRLIRVSESRIKQSARNARTGKVSEIEVGTIVFEEAGNWMAEEDILAVQWLNVNQIVVLTSTTMQVYDVHLNKLVERVHFDASLLVSPSLGMTVNGTVTYADSVGEVSHSVRVYKGKIFLLGRHELQVGTLLTWADRILSFVQEGDFLSAIDLTRSYYVGTAPGNRNGLPDDPQKRKDVVGEKMHDLMVASARYAFSEDRMTDGTHVTPDGRGVDRTSLFEGLVTTCARACVALDDLDFLFEELFQQYDDVGISRIFLLRLEPFVLDNEIRQVPPRITQRLVSLHADDNRPDLVERIIWHIDPACLDINQAILLCQKHHLYDALIYVYTRALRDYVSPVVELLGLIRTVHQYRKSRIDSTGPGSPVDDAVMEPFILNGYKIYPYLANVLSGLTYPSEEPLVEDEGFQAKKDIYTFLFFGRSSVWPLGEGGKLVLTSDEEGGVEPTYPYARLLLRFDAESFLHTLDIAFEDAYLNDETQGVSRLVIVRILLDILSSTSVPPAVATLVNIFIARNVPKYPQFLPISTSALHGILIALAEDPDTSTREDRQLAAEYLLSVYNPHESDRILRLFEKAGFFRILRSWHRQEQQWGSLLSTYLDDPNMHSTDVFRSIDDVLETSTRANKGSLTTELFSTITNALPQLLQASITRTAVLLDKRMPSLHEKALSALGQNADHERFLYLRHLLGPPNLEDEEYITSLRGPPSLNLTKDLRHLYISLHCRYHPSDVIDVLKFIPANHVDWPQVIQTCEDNGVYDAAVWALNSRGDPRSALSKAEIFEKRLTLRIVNTLSTPSLFSPKAEADIDKEVENLKALGRTAIAICLERSQGLSVADVPLEDIWFQLLSSQINCVQGISGCCSQEALAGPTHAKFEDEATEVQWRTLSALRSLVQQTFGALVSISSTRAVSFPRLFKRLVDPANHGHSGTGTPYTEFRTILTGMLESYRSEGDMLIITKHLVDRDLFETVEEATRERARGWAPLQGTCVFCRQALHQLGKGPKPAVGSSDAMQIIVSRTGTIYHDKCLPHVEI